MPQHVSHAVSTFHLKVGRDALMQRGLHREQVACMHSMPSILHGFWGECAAQAASWSRVDQFQCMTARRWKAGERREKDVVVHLAATQTLMCMTPDWAFLKDRVRSYTDTAIHTAATQTVKRVVQDWAVLRLHSCDRPCGSNSAFQMHGYGLAVLRGRGAATQLW